MAISILQRVGGNDPGGGGSSASAIMANNTAGSTIIVIVTMGDSTAILMNKEQRPPTDTKLNTYYLCQNAGFNTTNTSGKRIYAAYNVPAGANTVNVLDNGNETAISVYEVAGLPAYRAFDLAHVTNQGATTAYSSGASGTTSFANELILGTFATVVAAGAITAGAGYSNGQTNSSTSYRLFTEEKIVAATGAQTATATGTVAEFVLSNVITFADTGITPVANVSVYGSLINTTSGPHTVTATPAVGDLPVIIRFATGSTTSTMPTDNNADGLGSGAGAYVLGGTGPLKATSVDLMEIWVRANKIGSATSTVFTESPGTTTGGGLVAYKVTGMSKTGAAAVKQYASQSNQAANVVPAPALTNPITGVNPVISAVFNSTTTSAGNPANTHPPVGMAQSTLVGFGYATPTTGAIAAHNSGGSPSNTITWDAQSPTAFSSLAIELDTSASGTAYTSSLSGTYSTSGQLTDRAIVNLLPTAIYSTSGQLTVRNIVRSLSGLYKTTGLITLRSIVRPTLAGNYSTSGSLVTTAQHLISLTGTYSTSGVLTVRAVARTLSGLYKTSGLLNPRNFTRNISGTYSAAGNLVKRTTRLLDPATYSTSGSIATSRARGASFTGIYSTSGLITARAITRSLAAGYKTSGQLNKATVVTAFTGTYSASGTLLKRALKGLFSGTYSTSGLITARAIKRTLTSTYSTSGLLSGHSFTRTLTGTYKTSGVLNKRTFKALFSGTYSTSGNLASTAIVQFLVSVGGIYKTSGALTKKTSRHFTATYKTSGFFRTFIAPVFTTLGVIIGTLTQAAGMRDDPSSTLPDSSTIGNISDSTAVANPGGEINTQTINDSNQNITLQG